MGEIIPKLRASARGQQCVFQIPTICNHNPETTVLCHAPSDIKGMGNKGHDYHAAFGCSACHEFLDQHRTTSEHATALWLRGIMLTQNIWREKGLMTFPTTEPRPRRLSKVVAHPGHIRS